MSLLIDGYNLLHASDIFGEGSGPGYFQRSREALLAFLAASLKETERAQATIVFDAAEAPPGLPNHYNLEGLQVVYARDYPDADTLIEEMIEEHTAPRGLLVVSSDHRVQRAARRRGAKYSDSERWYTELWQRRVATRRDQQKSVPEKPVGKLSPKEIAYWVEQFDSEDLPNLAMPKTEQRDPTTGEIPEALENPFPPGYADDLLDGENL